MNEVEKNMAVEALAQLLDQQPTAYAEVLAACRAMGWNASPTAQPADIIDELPSNVLPFIRRMLALLIYGDGSADSPAVVPVTERCYAQMVPRVTSPNYPAAGFPSDHPFLPQVPSDRDFAHLPQALSALSPRKISGVNAEVPDGIGLAHLLCNSVAAATVTELTDTDEYDDINKTFPIDNFPSLTRLELNGKNLKTTIFGGTSRAIAVYLNRCETITDNLNAFYTSGQGSPNVDVHCAIKKLPYKSDSGYANYTTPYFRAGKVYWDELESGSILNGGDGTNKNATTYYMYIGCKGGRTDRITFYGTSGALTDLELRDGARQPIDTTYHGGDGLPGLTAQNIVNHILERLADNQFEDDGVTPAPAITIALGSGNLAKLTAEQIAIATNKNYTLA